MDVVAVAALLTSLYPGVTELEGVMDVVAVAASRQAGSTPCAAENGGCSHLCLYRGSGTLVCACPDVPDDRPCRTTPHFEVSSGGDRQGRARVMIRALGLVTVANSLGAWGLASTAPV